MRDAGIAIILTVMFAMADRASAQLCPPFYLREGRIGAVVCGDADEDTLLFMDFAAPGEMCGMRVGTLRITDYAAGGLSDFRREEHADSGMVTMSYKRGGVLCRREYLPSARDGVVAVRLSACGQGLINCGLTLTSLSRHTVKAGKATITLTGSAENSAGVTTHFCSQLMARARDGSVEALDSMLIISGATEAVLLFVSRSDCGGTGVAATREGGTYLERVTDDAWHLVNYSYEQLKARHLAYIAESHEERKP